MRYIVTTLALCLASVSMQSGLLEAKTTQSSNARVYKTKVKRKSVKGRKAARRSKPKVHRNIAN